MDHRGVEGLRRATDAPSSIAYAAGPPSVSAKGRQLGTAAGAISQVVRLERGLRR